MTLSPTEIKVKLLKNGDTIAGLAREWGTTPEVVSRVIYRRGYAVYPEVRQKLADYLGVSVSKVGREPSKNPKSKYSRDTKEAQAA
jgi:lambda repressor-like predicted transcriptional regulator